MKIPKTLLIVSLLLIVCQCSDYKNSKKDHQMLDVLETGLINFSSIEKVFAPDSLQLAERSFIEDRMQHYLIPGSGIAIINNNRFAGNRSYGLQDVNTGDSISINTLFEAASTSKLITAVLALKMVEAGYLELDRNVNEYLTRWNVPQNEYTLTEKVTLRKLLSHTAGLPESNFDLEEGKGIPSLEDVLEGNPPAMNTPAYPTNIPGSVWRYSNMGYTIIQLLLEEATKKAFAQLAHEEIFEPLDMKESSFLYPLDSTKSGREAMPHDTEGISRSPEMHPTSLAHGGMMTTPADLAKFTMELMKAYSGNSSRILSQDMARLLISTHSEVDPERIPFPFTEGLGVFLMDSNEKLMFTHPGYNSPGSSCWLMGWPQLGKGIVIMSNGARGDMLAMEIISAFNHDQIVPYN